MNARMPAMTMTTPPPVAQRGLPLLHALVLARIAVSTGATRTELVRDFGSFVANKLSPAEWRTHAETSVAALMNAGLVHEQRARVFATDAGLAAADEFLGKPGASKGGWPEIRDGRLIGIGLGLGELGPTRLKALQRPEGLRAAILQKAHGLAVRGNPSPSRLRAQLAVVALELAFGNKIKTGLGAGSGFSAKAGRLLAGQLSARPRDFGTDGKLIAGLAAEAVDARQTDLDALRQAILRGLFTSALQQKNRSAQPSGSPGRREISSELPRELPRAANDAGLPGGRTPEAARPDPEEFAKTVKAVAASCSEGWPGNRKSYISRVWEIVADRHAAWGLSDIEFKCMLAEAHRAGLVVLASADLKSKTTMEAIEASAITYKNTVWHFIRVDEA